MQQNAYFRVEVTVFPSQPFQKRRSFYHKYLSHWPPVAYWTIIRCDNDGGEDIWRKIWQIETNKYAISQEKYWWGCSAAWRACGEIQKQIGKQILWRNTKQIGKQILVKLQLHLQARFLLSSPPTFGGWRRGGRLLCLICPLFWDLSKNIFMGNWWTKE